MLRQLIFIVLITNNWSIKIAWNPYRSAATGGQPIINSHFLQEASTAKYIVQQYTAATGGQPALNSVGSMCVTGQVKTRASDFHQGKYESIEVKKCTQEVGGFVLWQKNPDLWCLELVVSGCKVSCGSNGKVSWRHSSNQQTPISKGPPRPLRRFLQVYRSMLSSSRILHV
jgi:hypothetical protein